MPGEKLSFEKITSLSVSRHWLETWTAAFTWSKWHQTNL